MKFQTRILSILICNLICLSVSAQIINFKIDGVVEDNSKSKYAYLTTLSQQRPISSDKIFIKMPIVNGKFTFKGNFNLEGKNYQFANIFIDERGNITNEEVAMKFQNLIWVSGRDSHLFKIILEDFSFTTKNWQDINNSMVTKGGKLNKDYQEYLLATKAGRTQLIKFINSHLNSPVSLHALQTLSFKEEVRDKPGESIEDLFHKLSPNISRSSDGILMKKSLKIK